MKTKEEVQRAHDMLVAVILGEVPVNLPKDELKKIRSAAGVLCWVLGHDHNPTFKKNLDNLEAHLRDKGFILCNRSN